ncbi:MAG: hypothetical protein GY710_03420 [Desulfobacteraceae bacterium]|nr:hypothetical protein [Desulfobacteraceae bacterium]
MYKKNTGELFKTIITASTIFNKEVVKKDDELYLSKQQSKELVSSGKAYVCKEPIDINDDQKISVSELAKALNVDNKAIIEIANELNISAKGYNSKLTSSEIEIISKAVNGAKEENG